MEKFAEQIMEELDRMLDDDYWMKYMETEKGNGMIYHGILIVKENEDTGPLVYIDYYLKKYQEGSLTIPEIASAILYRIGQHPVPSAAIDRIRNHYDEVKEEIRIAVCNYMANEEELIHYPHQRLLDLAVFYYIPLQGMNGWEGTIRISYLLLEKWDITEQDLFRQAEWNARHRISFTMTSFRDFLKGFFEKRVGKEAAQAIEKIKPRFFSVKWYILSNAEHFWGAGLIADWPVLQSLAERFQDDIVIYPCSIHELIIMKKSDYGTNPLSPDNVEEINEEKVPWEERLSNNIYLYSREKKELMVYMEGGLL
jgi:hypothetical protein